MKTQWIRTVDSKHIAGGPARMKLKNGDYLTFVHTPKTGGMSILNWSFHTLFQGKMIESIESYNLHLSLNSIKTLTSWKDLGTIFTVVRNPYLRYISFWNWETYSKKKEMTFPECWVSWKTAKEMIQPLYWEGCDIVIRFENLKEEFDEKISIPFFGRTFELGRENYTGTSYGLEDINDIIPKDIRDEIFELDKETFEKFGYDRDA